MNIGKFIGKCLFYRNLYRLQPVFIVLFSHVCPAIVEIAGFFVKNTKIISVKTTKKISVRN